MSVRRPRPGRGAALLGRVADLPPRMRSGLAIALVALVLAIGVVASLNNGQPAATSPGGDGHLFGSASIDLVDLVAKTLLVVILAVVALRLLGRNQTGAASQRRIRVLESQSLPNRAALHLVAFGERRILVGQTLDGLTALAEASLDELGPDPEPAGPVVPGDFTAALGQSMRRFRQARPDEGGS